MVRFITRAAGLLAILSSSSSSSSSPWVLAAPAPQTDPQTSTPPADSNACGVVAQAQAKQMAEDPNAIPRVSAAVAFACLQTVPNKPEPAAKLIKSLKAYIQWQSSLAWLKDPPPSYMLPATDIEAGLDGIAANASAGKFPSEYAFQESIVRLVASAHDGHFAYRPDVFKAFSFRNDIAADIVSVSVDGKQPPRLYNLGVLNGTATIGGLNGTSNGTARLVGRRDAGASNGPSNGTSSGNSTTGMPPAITKINGQDAAQLLERQGLEFINFQDPDSQWNAQFQQYAVPDARPVLSASIFYQGDSLSVEYDNGQVVTQETYALIRPPANFSGVSTGEDFYNRFCNPDAAANSSRAGSPTQQEPPPAPTGPKEAVPTAIAGFPTPAIRDSGADVTAGYFLSGSGYEDVAVLSVLGFAPTAEVEPLAYVVDFQNMTERFLAMCRQADKRRLVIDLTGNGGGLVAAGYELYSQLFPNTPLFQANNLRLTGSMDQIARIAAAAQPDIAALDPATLGPTSPPRDVALAVLASSTVVSNLVPGGVFSAGGRVKYASVQEIVAPVELKGDRFTAYQSTPLNETASDFNLTGTGNRADPSARATFAADQIVLLTDGTCGSTCTLFSYLMIMQQNVKTVAVGGRPQAGPMQSIAGVEGAQVFDLGDLQQAAAAAMVVAGTGAGGGAGGADEELAVLAEGYALDRAASAANAGAVNGKNAFSHTDAQTPLQFLMQPAQCHFFYTRDMIRGPEATWKRAVDATFTDPQSFCVDGSVTPTMGVQNISDDFFTTAAMGGATLQGQVNGNSPSSSWGAAGAGPPATATVLVAAMMAAVAGVVFA